MAVIGVKTFGGMHPKLQPRLLNENEAQAAIDVVLESGALAPMKSTTALKALTSVLPRTLYRYAAAGTAENLHWLEFAGDVDVARSLVVEDAYDRLYWTDGTKPRYAINSMITAGSTLPGSSYNLGIPKPVNKPAATPGAPTSVTMVSREYVMTLYSASSESAPGPVVTAQTVDGQGVKLSDLPTDNGGDTTVLGKRIYRKVSGTYRRVATLPLLDATYVDSASDASLAFASTLPATSLMPPPESAAVASVTTAATLVTAINRQYVYTYKNVIAGGLVQYAESPPSAPAAIAADSTQSVTINGFAPMFGGTYSHIRIYRRDSGAPTYQLVGEIPVGTTSFVDPVGTTVLGQPLQFDLASAFTPASPPTLAASGSTGYTSANLLKRAYLIVYEDASGGLSTPSPMSNVVDAINGATVVGLSHTDSPPVGVSFKRIYRQNLTVSGVQFIANVSNWRLVGSAAAGATTFSDNVSDISLGAYLPSGNAIGIGAPDYSATAQGTVSSPPPSEARSYVYTYVSAYGEEGPPSTPSDAVTVQVGVSATVSGMSGPPAGNFNITLKRIYRTATGTSGGTEFQFVAEVPVATASYSDSVVTAALGEVLPSETWIAPPDALQGLRATASGYLVGFVGKSVCASEPYMPHAWPTKNRISVAANIVGIAVTQQSTYLLTDTFPYEVTGVDPSALSPTRLAVPQACVSKRSIVETGDGVLYASPDGIVSLGAKLENLTEQVLTREQWQAYNPASIHAYFHERRYYAFYTKTTGERGLLVFDFSGTGPMMTTASLGAATEVTAAHRDATTDTLYLACGGNILRLNASNTPLTGKWASKRWRLTRPEVMAAGAINAAGYPVTLRVYADGALSETRTIESGSPFRLKSGFRAQEWEFQIDTDKLVYDAQFASSMDELKQV